MRAMQLRPLPRAAAVAALGCLAVLAPLALTALEPPVLAVSYGRSATRLELFAAFASLAAGMAAAFRLREREGRPASELVPVLTLLLVTLVYAFVIGEYARKPFDYDCYEYAGRAILLGEDPYVVGLLYLYPPLTAQSFALAHHSLTWAVELTGRGIDPEAIWHIVFYLFQCAQLGLILLAYALLTRFARAVGMEEMRAHAVVALLLLVDNPLLRTLRNGQVNLWILDLSLLAILLARRIPWLSGFALALSVHVKLYPLVVALPFALARCWRAIAWTVAGGALIVLVQTDLGRDWTVWRQFLDFYGRVYPGEIAFRNSSFHSVLYNTLRFLWVQPSAGLLALVRLASSVFSLAMGLWLLLRTVARERSAVPGPDRLLTNAADALAFSLLISQSVWEHHFLLALPVAILAVETRWRERPLAVAVSLFLVLGMPTFDLYPLGYHRLAGLIGLLVLTRPKRPLAGPDA
jgi:hypothetical protein